jgi:hypothetical protein
MYGGRNKGRMKGVATFHQAHQRHVFHVWRHLTDISGEVGVR